MNSDPKNTLYLIDISSFIFRAFFAIRPLHTKGGEPVNAVYGVATMLARLVDDAKPQFLAAVYDSKEPSFRKEVYPEYKANRTAPPDDLIPQFDRVEELIKCMEIPGFRQSGVEADDLIATLTKKWCKSSPKHQVVIVSSDKDLMQLVDERVRIWDTMSNKVYGIPEVIEKFGVKPTQIRDYLGLVGDSSDNIPGVPGVGPKTAADLLKEYGDMDAVLAAAKAGSIPGKRGETLKANEKDARLSAELATVKEDLKVEPTREKVTYRFHVSEDCARLLTSLDFHSLLTRWNAILPHGAVGVTEPGSPISEPAQIQQSLQLGQPGQLGSDAFRTVNSEKEFQKLLESMDRAKEFGFDLETTSLNPRQAEICGVAICHDPAFGLYIPINHRGTSVEQLPAGMVMERLKPFLENPKYKKIGQNLKYDWEVLAEKGIRADGIGADTMVASYVLDPEGRHNLDTLASTYLGYQVQTYEMICGKGKDAICFDQVPIAVATRYSAEDALIAVRLWNHLRKKLEEEKLMEVFTRVDLPLVQVLARMELHGVNIDVPFLKKLSKEFEKDLQKIQERIEAFTKGPINLNSPKQLGVLLFEQLKLPVQSKTKTGFSTDVTVLEALAPLHEVPRLLLEFREISKLKGTYVDPLPELKDPKDGRIHAGFHQTVAATGRLSSSDPNLQNIPIKTERGKMIRKAFIPTEGNCLVAADYSQIELRLLAHMSGDPDLSRSFKKDEDVHRRTASEIFDIPPEKVDDRQRGIAKAINFGLMYGKTAFGLAQELKIPRKEAQDVIDRYFKRYSGVKKYLDETVLEARETGFVLTMLGRKRRLPDIRSANQSIRQNAERMAMNSPIQGTAADLMKLAMIEIDERLTREGFRSKLIIQVHDEVVLDCPKKEVKDVERLITEVMVGAQPGRVKMNVPLQVNSGSGANWMEL